MTAQPNELENKIDNMDWTLFDRFMYGGLVGSSPVCLPTNLAKIISTILFPPMGTILKHLKLSDDFPYITTESLRILFENINDIIYSFVLTALFYIPGLIYGLSSLKCMETSPENIEKVKDVTDKDIKDYFQNIKKRKNIKQSR